MEGTPKLTAIAAVARNGVIGDGRALPWHLPDDFRRFKRVTMGGALIMGRRTFESMGRPLPGRTSIVLTRAKSWFPGGRSDPVDPARHDPAGPPTEVVVVHNVAQALAELVQRPDQRWWCAGGGEIYQALWPYVTHLDLTEVKAEPAGTTRFPPIDPTQWRLTSRELHDQFDFVAYVRRSPEAAEALYHALTSPDAL